MNTEVIVFEQDNKQVIQENSKFFTRVFQNGENFESGDFNTLEKAKASLGIAPTTEESNKLIAEFMGFDIDKRNPNTILYHSDWNWLMEVVEKIESKGFDVHINTCVCRVSDVGEDRFEDIETFNSNSKLQAVYQAVLEFIKWYKNQTN
jgi:hypothetical protein